MGAETFKACLVNWNKVQGQSCCHLNEGEAFDYHLCILLCMWGNLYFQWSWITTQVNYYIYFSHNSFLHLPQTVQCWLIIISFKFYVWSLCLVIYGHVKYCLFSPTSHLPKSLANIYCLIQKPGQYLRFDTSFQ